MNCAARAESSVKLSSIAVITGAALNILLDPAFGLGYMMTITHQTIGTSRYGLFLSAIRQGVFYIPCILILPKLLGVGGIYASQPAADILTILVCVFSIPAMKRIASNNMRRGGQ